eukprot:88388-Chlamydomonas_euryale.AAC.3
MLASSHAVPLTWTRPCLGKLSTHAVRAVVPTAAPSLMSTTLRRVRGRGCTAATRQPKATGMLRIRSRLRSCASRSAASS